MPLECRLQVSSPSNFVRALTAALAGDLVALLAELEALPPPATATERAFWQEERETLTKLRPLAVDSVATQADRELRSTHHE